MYNFNSKAYYTITSRDNVVMQHNELEKIINRISLAIAASRFNKSTHNLEKSKWRQI